MKARSLHKLLCHTEEVIITEVEGLEGAIITEVEGATIITVEGATMTTMTTAGSGTITTTVIVLG